MNFSPFGLKHKGYNNVVSSNGNSTAQKFKYNGVEYEESLGLNLYEMDVRSYDPAIGRFTSIDPIIHFDFSTYTAFDNNPIYWADPSGADAESKSTEDLINDAWNQTPENGSATFDNQGSCNCGCPGKPPCEANTSPPDFKKAKNAGEFYAMAYSMNSHQSFAASNGLNGLTAFQIMEYDDAMDQFGAEVITWVAGGVVFKLIVKGGKVLYAAYAANKALKGAKFLVNANKFNYFFGRVVSGNAHNIARSAQNLKDLTTLGIQSEGQLMRVFAKAFANGSKVCLLYTSPSPRD